jgi:hypothetical protein
MATVDVPGQWANRTVTVKLHKAGYKDKTFEGTVNSDGTFTPVVAYPKIESKQGTDYSFLVIVIIVLLILGLVLFSLKGPSKEEGEEDEEEKDGEESLSEDE